jgi:hypothetical protein
VYMTLDENHMHKAFQLKRQHNRVGGDISMMLNHNNYNVVVVVVHMTEFSEIPKRQKFFNIS